MEKPNAKILQMLSGLIGMRLWAAGRAADLAWFIFGERRIVKDFRGNPKEVGEYSLHVQCAWRIVRGEQVVVASRDLYYPADSTDPVAPPGFQWDVQGGNRMDVRLKEFLESMDLFVVQVEVSRAGAFQLSLGDDVALEVIPDDSFESEHWRLFRPYTDEEHFVVGGQGIIEE